MKYVMVYETAPDGLEKAKTYYQEHQARLNEFHAKSLLLMTRIILLHQAFFDFDIPSHFPGHKPFHNKEKPQHYFSLFPK